MTRSSGVAPLIKRGASLGMGEMAVAACISMWARCTCNQSGPPVFPTKKSVQLVRVYNDEIANSAMVYGTEITISQLG